MLWQVVLKRIIWEVLVVAILLLGVWLGVGLGQGILAAVCALLLAGYALYVRIHSVRTNGELMVWLRTTGDLLVAGEEMATAEEGYVPLDQKYFEDLLQFLAEKGNPVRIGDMLDT